MSGKDRLAANSTKATRRYEEPDHPLRSKFQRDRDRIIFSKAFRRLKGKTQVFLSGFDDHIRNRLTHTLEVSQIATTICASLGLDHMLTEAISLGHDLGHTPFGHVGERILNDIMCGGLFNQQFSYNIDGNDKGFKHNWQSVRVVEDIEPYKRDYCGLNLTKQTLWGILHHSSLSIKSGIPKYYLQKYSDLEPYSNLWSFEALIVSFSDEIAQRHHDFEDGIVAGLIDKNEVIDNFEFLFKDYFSEIDFACDFCKIKNENYKQYYVTSLTRMIIDFYSRMAVKIFKHNMEEIKKQFNIKDDFDEKKPLISDHFKNNKLNWFAFDGSTETFLQKERDFHNFLKNRVLNSYQAQQMDGRSEYIIRKLFKAYLNNPEQLPDHAIVNIFRSYDSKPIADIYVNDKPKANIIGDLRNRLHDMTSDDQKFKVYLFRTICDYISGMSDEYATHQYKILYGAKEISNW